MSETVHVMTSKGAMSCFMTRPSATARGAVVVLQEIFGVNADMRETCDWLAAKGFVAISPDLFWRMEAGVDMSDRTQDEWQRGFALYTALDRDLALADVAATLAYARSLVSAQNGVGVMGYCLGGLLTFLAAAGVGADAAVAYYGGETERYLDQVAHLDAPLMMHLAAEDEYISKDAQRAIQKALRGRADTEVHKYAGCNHAFARRGGAHHDKSAAMLANERTLRFLFEHLR